MALASGASLVSVTQSFTVDTTFSMPADVSLLNSVIGQGGSGSPSYTTGGPYYNITYSTFFTRRDGGPQEVVTSTDTTRRTGSHPANSTGPFVFTPDSTIYVGYFQVTEYTDYDDTVTHPATTGADTTGFGKTFPGGVGGAATPVTYTNVTVTPSGSYPLVIPSGGSITITYQH